MSTLEAKTKALAPTTQPERTLRHAKALLTKGWCRDHLATTIDHTSTDELGDKAFHFCSLGAINCAAHGSANLNQEAILYLCAVVNAHYGPGIPTAHWNDTLATKAEVLEFFDQAIRMAHVGLLEGL